MRLLIVGGSGMLGHRVWLAARDQADAWVTLRGTLNTQPWASLFEPGRTIEGVDAADPDSLARAMRTARPDTVINAAGLIKQRDHGDAAGPAFVANCFLPHELRRLCDNAGARLIQVSTDCVFTGSRGGYTEADQPDATDTYGLTKRLGEVAAPHLTLRTSLIGRSLAGTDGLLEWFLAQRGPVAGYRRAIFSGLTTQVLAETLLAVATGHPDLAGIWHVASEPINKLDLLGRVRGAYGLNTEINPANEPVIDRSLVDRRFRDATAIARPTWDGMMAGLAADQTPYARLRGEPC
jgi:dTDP-4-dehydrorhamnose reductase